MRQAILVGCDPEFLCASKGFFKSVIGLIPGTKEEPAPINDGTIQVDGVAVELGIIPAGSIDLFDARIASVLKQAADMVASYGLDITTKASADFSVEDLMHPDAQRLGCEPDFNAWWGGSQNPSPSPDGSMRVAGGHVHVGCDGVDTLQLIKALDLCVAIPSLHLEDPMRKLMYGKAGCFRPKSYGVEYRTPSNFWTFTSERRKWLFNQVCKAVDIHRTMEFSEQIQRVIDMYDVDSSLRMSSEFGMELCPE